MGKLAWIDILIVPALLSSCALAPAGPSQPTATSLVPLTLLPPRWTPTLPEVQPITVRTAPPSLLASPTPQDMLPATADPSEVAPSSQERITLHSLQMRSTTEGWGLGAVGEKARPGVFRTSDAGRTWREVSPSGTDLGPDTRRLALSSLNPKVAWLTLKGPGEDPAYVFSASTVTVYSTTDGGESWASSVPFRIQAGYPDPPVFVDPLHGWMLIVLAEYHTSWSVEVRRTNDGGRTWELASRTEPHMDDPLYPDTPGGLPVNCIKNGISFVHKLFGWATGQCYDVQYPFLVVEALFLYATSDGGSTWAHRSLPVPEGLPANASDLWYTNISPPVFFSGGAGYMTVTLRLQDDTVVELLYTTPDGGINWVGRTLPQGIWLLRFVTPSQGWVYAHEEDQLYATADGGATWTAIGPYPERAALGSGDFVFADSSHGWISRGDRIDLTEDGGRTWLRFTPVLASTK